jgi:60 kDa SS-A/Ro ribonucleoprotein
MRTNTPVVRPPILTHEGAPAHRIGAAAELRRTLMACLLWEDTFYEDGEDVAARITRLVAEVKPEQVMAMAIEAREQMKLRHAPLFVARGLAARRPVPQGLAALLERIIQRPDELAEFLALYWKPKKQPLAAAVKRGLAAAFRKFDAYRLAKYNRDGAVKLRDVLFLTHAKPKDEAQAATWKQLVEGALPAPDTWEVALSGGKDKRETWERLIAEQKLGALALLRNLRNMKAAGVPIGTVRAALESMKVERVLPFRFIAAARYAPELEPALEQAMYRALADVPKLGGRTAVVVDNSGSMEAPLSSKSEMLRQDAASGLAILAREICADPVIIGFGTDAKLLPARRGFALRDAIRQGPGGGTNTELAKQLADREGYDRIVILTDEQSHQAISAPKGRGYIVNVGTHEHGIGYGPWTHIDGWSEAVLSYVAAAEGQPVSELS